MEELNKNIVRMIIALCEALDKFLTAEEMSWVNSLVRLTLIKNETSPCQENIETATKIIDKFQYLLKK
jgi:DNA-binding XRE family transcriptional regulator